MGDMTIKLDSFVRTAPIYNPNSPKGVSREPILNPQTAQLCDKLGIDDPLQVFLARTGKVLNTSVVSEEITTALSTVATPIRTSKLLLPAPVTPSSINKTEDTINQDEISISDTNDTVDTITQNEISISNTNDTVLSDSTLDTSACLTPATVGKKTFKRRNEALYNRDEVEDSQGSLNAISCVEGSPSKIAAKDFT